MIDAQAKKLEIIERVLHLDSEEDLLMVDDLLDALNAQDAGFDDIPSMPPITATEMIAGIREAEADIKAGRVYTHEEAKAIAQQWRQA